MKLIVGLGNPENQYDGTRHNIGFMCVNVLAERYGVSFKHKFNADAAEVMVGSEKVIFIKPDTYMNNSGEAVIKYMQFYKIDVSDVVIIYDDLDMMFGKIRIKKKSSSGGHNGIKSIMSHLKCDDFLKVKIGIRNEFVKDVKNFVLANFSKVEQKELTDVYNKVDNIVGDFIKDNDGIKLMNKYN